MATVRAIIDESWTEFLAVLDSVPKERLEEPGACGDWSVKDLMAHMAFWDDRAVFVTRRLAAGEELEPIDWQEVNLQEAALRSNWSLEQSRSEMMAAHERVIEAVERLPDLDASAWEGNTFEHYDEHAADIRAWLAEKSE
jgi:hypothetical protein